MTPPHAASPGEWASAHATPPAGARAAPTRSTSAARRRPPLGRHGQEVATVRDAEAARLRARAERAEAQLAEQRREAARAIGALRSEVTFWRLRAEGASVAEAAAGAGLLEPPAE